MNKLFQGLRALCYAAVGFAVIAFIVKAPTLHDQYLRYEVGNEVVRMLGEQGGGTGFHVKAKSGKTYILTNSHVCELKDKDGWIKVQSKNQEPVRRKVIEHFPKHDLCLVESLSGHSGIDVANSQQVGDEITVVGHPGLRPLTLSKGEYVGNSNIELLHAVNTGKQACPYKFIDLSGTIYALLFGIEDACLREFETNQISAPIYGGNSGSPVVNFYGNVVGVVFAGNGKQVHGSYAVPLSYIKDFLNNY